MKADIENAIMQCSTCLEYQNMQPQEKTTPYEVLVLCNPKFVNKNNWYFDLSSIYFLYPLTSLPKMVKQEMLASIEQSQLIVLVTRCWSSFVFRDQ